MYRVIKWGFVSLLAYAAVTATPAQQLAMLQGVLALKDALLSACEREGSPCTKMIASAKAVLESHGWVDAAVAPAPGSDSLN